MFALSLLLLSLCQLILAKCPTCRYNYEPDYSSLLNTGLGKPICSNNEYRQIDIDVDGATKAFHFTTSYGWAYESFRFTSAMSTFLFVWDCFCAGDAFRIYDNGVAILDVNPDPNDFDDCNIRIDYPLFCFEAALFGQQLFAGNSTILPPGEHNLTIAILESPFSSGSAFLTIKSMAIYGEIPACVETGSCDLANIEGQCQLLY